MSPWCVLRDIPHGFAFVVHWINQLTWINQLSDDPKTDPTKPLTTDLFSRCLERPFVAPPGFADPKASKRHVCDLVQRGFAVRTRRFLFGPRSCSRCRRVAIADIFQQPVAAFCGLGDDLVPDLVLARKAETPGRSQHVGRVGEE